MWAISLQHHIKASLSEAHGCSSSRMYEQSCGLVPWFGLVVAWMPSFGSKGWWWWLCRVEILKDIGVDWVILGHSERRALLGETSEVRAALCDRCWA